MLKPILSFNTSRSLSSTAVPSISKEQVFDFDRNYLSCSIPNSNRLLKVAVLLSGGVDSSVALRLLHGAGHSCPAFYLKIWFQEDFENFWSECPWEEDLKHAKAVCNQIDVPLEVVHLTDEYWDKVVHLWTPSVTWILTLLLLDIMQKLFTLLHMKTMSFHSLNSQRIWSKIRYTFFSIFHRLSFEDLCFLWMYSKVPQLARKFDLPNQDRRDLQGICFLGKIKFSVFVGRHIGEKEGIILEAETGDFLGSHRGFWFYTIGQRQGLKLAGGPWYVVEKDVKNNVVFVSRNYYSVDKIRRSFRVGSFRWISGFPPSHLDQLKCKVRHGPDFYNCTLHMELAENGTENIGTVQLPEDDQGLAACQFAAFYKEHVCVGSGVILESWDDNAFPVCDKAREIAKIEDKSKLGKPVKITPKPEDCLRSSSVKML